MSDEAPDGGPDWRTDTAERPRVRATLPPREPRLPPAAVEPPPPARWPLYADDQPAPPAESEPDAVSATWSYGVPDSSTEDDWFASAAAAVEEDRGSPLLWVLVTVLVVAAVAAGWWYLARAS